MHSYTGDAALLRKVNESAILELIRDQGPLSRSDVARILQLSPPTVGRIVNLLVDADLVIEGEQGQSSGGRPPTMLTLNARQSLIIGVYVHENMVAALADLNGDIIERQIRPARPGDAGIRQLIALVQQLRMTADQMGAPIKGVGIGAPSVTHSQEGMVVWAPVYGWRDLPLKRDLEAALSLPVFVENEVNLIALGESWRGAGQGVKHLVCISLGPGIGAGIVLNGRLLRGAHDAAGEIGYFIPNERYLGQQFEDYGCLEELAGSNGIARRAEQRLAMNEPSMLAETWSSHSNSLTVQAVLEAARSGDPLANAVVQETADYLSIAIINLACVLDPERIVMGGDLVEHGDLFIPAISQRLAGVVPVVPEIILSDLGMDAPVLGAVALVLRRTSDRLFIHAQDK